MRLQQPLLSKEKLLYRQWICCRLLFYRYSKKHYRGRGYYSRYPCSETILSHHFKSLFYFDNNERNIITDNVKKASQLVVYPINLIADFVFLCSQKRRKAYPPKISVQIIAETTKSIKKSAGPKNIGTGPNHFEPCKKTLEIIKQ